MISKNSSRFRGIALPRSAKRWMERRFRFYFSVDSKMLKEPSVRRWTRIGARYDTMDPKHMEWMAGAFKNGWYLYCPDGSHLAMYDDQQAYVSGLIRFIKNIETGRVP